MLVPMLGLVGPGPIQVGQGVKAVDNVGMEEVVHGEGMHIVGVKDMMGLVEVGVYAACVACITSMLLVRVLI
jgi:hypothetical protein